MSTIFGAPVFRAMKNIFFQNSKKQNSSSKTQERHIAGWVCKLLSCWAMESRTSKCQDFEQKTGNYMEVSVSSWGYPQLSSIDFHRIFHQKSTNQRFLGFLPTNYGVSPISNYTIPHYKGLNQLWLTPSGHSKCGESIQTPLESFESIDRYLGGWLVGTAGLPWLPWLPVRDQYGHGPTMIFQEIPIMMGQTQVTSEFVWKCRVLP